MCKRTLSLAVSLLTPHSDSPSQNINIVDAMLARALKNDGRGLNPAASAPIIGMEERMVSIK